MTETPIDAAMTPFETEEYVPTLKDMVIDAIVGVGFPTMAIGIAAEKEHMAYFRRDGVSGSWAWYRDKLRNLSEEKLQALYVNLKVAQHAS